MISCCRLESTVGDAAIASIKLTAERSSPALCDGVHLCHTHAHPPTHPPTHTRWTPAASDELPAMLSTQRERAGTGTACVSGEVRT
jgi:hypothetical protein